MMAIDEQSVLLLLAAGCSLTYLRMGGNIFGAVIIFIIAKMIGE